MKKGFLLLLLCSSVFVNAQSLKDALFSGKLKNDAGTVIRKGDDLSTKIDTATRKPPVDSAVAKVAATDAPATGAIAATTPTSPANSVAAGQEKKEVAAATTDSAAAAETAAAPETTVSKTANNNLVLKGFMDTLISTLKTDVIPSKKLKEGSYLVLVSYAIETDGQLSFTDIFVSPENNFLQDQIKQRLAIDVPRLQPEVTSTGKPRKVNKKYKFTLEKQ